MTDRTNTAAWLEKYNRWQIKVQKDGMRRTFTSSKPGRVGQREANAKADEWLASIPAEITPANACMLDVIEEWIITLERHTSKGNWRPAISRVRRWIIPIIGHIPVRNLTEQHLQNVLDLAYTEGHLSEKTLKNVRGDITGLLKYCRKSKYTNLLLEGLDIPTGAVKNKRVIGYVPYSV